MKNIETSQRKLLKTMINRNPGKNKKTILSGNNTTPIIMELLLTCTNYLKQKLKKKSGNNTTPITMALLSAYTSVKLRNRELAKDWKITTITTISHFLTTPRPTCVQL